MKRTLLKKYRKGQKKAAIESKSDIPTQANSGLTQTQTQTKPADWVDRIPYEIKYDIAHAVKLTKKDNKEKSLSFCRIKGKDKIHTSAFAFGAEMSTEVLPCNEKYGENTVKVGDLHTHPFGSMAMGITPSEADFSSTLYDSWQYKNRQIGCVTNHGSKMIHCYQPKHIPTWQKVNQYNVALDTTGKGNEVDPYLRENIGRDFSHSWYDRKTFNRIQSPSSDDVLSDALGGSAKRYRSKDIVEIERGTFCDIVQDYNLPENNELGQKCRDFMQGDPPLKVADPKKDENIRLDIPRLRIPRLKIPKIGVPQVPDVRLPGVDYPVKINTRDYLPI